MEVEATSGLIPFRAVIFHTRRPHEVHAPDLNDSRSAGDLSVNGVHLELAACSFNSI